MSDVAARLQDLSPAGKRALLAKIVSIKRSRGKTAPLSHAQQRLWFLEQMVSGNPFYNESSAWRLLFPIDRTALELSLNEIIRRHEALRTNFEAEDGEPVQRILPSLTLDLPVVDLTYLPDSGREAEAVRLASEQARRPFDLSRAPLLRASLLMLGRDDHIFVLTMHHIVCDGWSMRVFFNELRVLYEAFLSGRSSPLPPLTLQYADYASWQRKWLQGRPLEEQMSYWRKQLEGVQTLQLPADKPRPAVPSFNGGRVPITITSNASHMNSLCERESVTPFMVLLAAFQVLLHRHTGQDDIAIGCPIANRNRPELEQLIGFFVNTLVFRADLSGGPSFRELLRRVRETSISAYAHQDLPFEKLVEEIQPERDPGRNPLFQVSFQILSEGAAEPVPADLLQVLDVDLATSKLDLRLDLIQTEKGWSGYLEYSSDLFEAGTASWLAAHYETLVSRLIAHPERSIGTIPFLCREEVDMLRRWNETACEFPSRECAPQRIEAVAAADPGRLAVDDGVDQLTFGKLNSHANQLAHYMRRIGVQPGSLVAVLLDRSASLVVAELAIMKAGAAFVPLDPSHPKERVLPMLQQASPPLVITERAYEHRVLGFVPHLCIEDRERLTRDERITNPPVQIDERSLAYVIFTSGSTGKPSGVEIQHAGLNNLIGWYQRDFAVTGEDRSSLYASPGFDATVFEIWPCLTAGGSLHVPNRETQLSPQQLAEWMARQAITISFLPTAVVSAFLEQPLPQNLTLRLLKTGGEQLRSYPARPLPFRFVNLYGPTENSVASTYFDVQPPGAVGVPPIGKPVANTTLYVLDGYGQLSPVGSVGELYVSGVGLARGYLNDDALTRQRFVPNRFDSQTGSRMYRTGDLVRFRNDGNLEFHGRADSQIKLRGFRIEPGDIEAAIDQHPCVMKSAVVLHTDDSGEKSLVAYVAQKAKSGDAGDASRVGEWSQIYEQLYRGEPRDDEFDIVGWNSSYTGQPISAEEMREQVTATTARIAALGGKCILEIGCGTGLLLLRLAGQCERYVGTDFSRAVIERLRETVRRRGWSHVELSERRADDFSGLAPGEFDVVVLNSVIQYFPTVEYLLQVLEGAMRMLRPGGFVFVGDVRNLRLMPLLHGGIERLRAGEHTSAGELREQIERRGRQEVELLIDPGFFHALPVHFDIIKSVSVQLRRGTHDNELTRFRYDAMMQVGGTAERLGAVVTLRWNDLGSLHRLRSYLHQQQPRALRITDVPNLRVIGEQQWLDALYAADASVPARAVPCSRGQGIDPESLWVLEEELPYRVQLTWSADPGALDVLFAPKGGALFVDEQIAQPEPWRAYANVPATRSTQHDFVENLRAFLREKLPEYMVPSTIICLDALPTMPSGKLNRRALPSLGRPARRGSGGQLPRNDIESKVAAIWQEVLGLAHVGVQDNFFDLGGHSLLLVRVHARLRSAFDTTISIVDLFRLPTVEALARAIATKPDFTLSHSGGMSA